MYDDNEQVICDKCAKELYSQKGTFEPEIGDIVKLEFGNPEVNSQIISEHMWCLVVKKTEQGYIGILDNTPKFFFSLKHGDSILFSKTDVEALRKPDEEDLKYQMEMLNKFGVNLDSPKSLKDYAIKNGEE
jgi:uncharacterized protein YegJ (DUF2314 family)